MKNIYIITFIVFLLTGCSQNSVKNSTNNITEKSTVKLNPLCNIQQPPKDRCEGIHYGVEFNKNKGTCEFVSWGCSNPPFIADENCSWGNDFEKCKNSVLNKCRNICEKQP